jgi:DNA-binding MarR family transcriptional regulator
MSNRAINWALATGLPTTPKFVLVVLADLADEEDSCFPGQEYLANAIGGSVRTVTRALADLEKLGYLSRSHRQLKSGFRSSDRYVLSVPKRSPDPT